MSAGTAAGVDQSLWRAIGVFRVASLAYALVLYVQVDQDYAHPRAGWAVVGAMAGWTALTVAALRRPDRRRWPLLTLDLGAAVLAVAATAWLDDPDRSPPGPRPCP